MLPSITNMQIVRKKDMKKAIVFFFVIAITLSTSFASNERYPWLYDLDKAREIAKIQKKPLFIVFRCEP